MGEHPSVSLAPKALEDTPPLIWKGAPSKPENPAPPNRFVSRKYLTDKDLNSSSQCRSLHRDPSFHALIQKARSHNPSHRPNLLSVVLQLQQTVARYFLCLSVLPLPAPASLSASLSLYMPRTPVMTPSPIPIEDFPEYSANGTPSPSCPNEPSYPHHPPLSHTLNADLISDTPSNRLTRNSRSMQAGHGKPSVSLDILSETASRTNYSPTLSPLAPSQYVNAERANSSACCCGFTRHPAPRTRRPAQDTYSMYCQDTSRPVAMDGFGYPA